MEDRDASREGTLSEVSFQKEREACYPEP